MLTKFAIGIREPLLLFVQSLILTGANLTKTNFSNTNLAEAVLLGADLSQAILPRAEARCLTTTT